MISASALMRNCGHPRVLSNLPPTDAKGRARRASRDVSAARGSIFHAAVDGWITGKPTGPVEDGEIVGWLDVLGSKWAPPTGTECETAWGLGDFGAYVEVDEPKPHVYVARDGSPLLTAGRTDAHWIGHDGRLYVLDWKTGRTRVTEPARNLQINAACIALMDLTAAPAYVPGIYYARDGVFEWGDPVELGSPEYRSILAEVVTAARLDNEPRPGDHCGTCFERRSCAHAQKESVAWGVDVERARVAGDCDGSGAFETASRTCRAGCSTATVRTTSMRTSTATATGPTTSVTRC